MKFHSAATALLIAGITGGVSGPGLVAASAATAQAQPSFSASESAISALPISPKELLVRIQSALARGELLSDAFYSPDHLEQFFGFGYRYKVGNDAASQKTIYFDDGDNIYVDEHGEPTLLGRHRPCLRRGTILFEAGGPSRKAKASIAISTTGPAAPDSAFGADLVLEVFGAPSAVTEGSPSAPPLHGQAYQAPPQTNELGNHWLAYQAEPDRHLQRAKFRTLGDATVIEIQLFEEQR